MSSCQTSSPLVVYDMHIQYTPEAEEWILIIRQEATIFCIAGKSKSLYLVYKLAQNYYTS